MSNPYPVRGERQLWLHTCLHVSSVITSRELLPTKSHHFSSSLNRLLKVILQASMALSTWSHQGYDQEPTQATRVPGQHCLWGVKAATALTPRQDPQLANGGHQDQDLKVICLNCQLPRKLIAVFRKLCSPAVNRTSISIKGWKWTARGVDTWRVRFPISRQTKKTNL